MPVHVKRLIAVIPDLEKLAKDKACANPCLEKIKNHILLKFHQERESSGMFMVQKHIYTKALKVSFVLERWCFVL